jgi:hypothetical protein
MIETNQEVSTMSQAVIRNWKRIVKQWEKSGLTKAEFCRQQKISPCQFSYHSIKHKAFSEDWVNGNSPKEIQFEHESFAEVICKPSIQHPAESSTSLTLCLDCGGSIELTSGFDDEILKRVLEIAKAL